MTVPRWIVPVLILIMTALGLWTARLIAIPSVTVDYSKGGPSEIEGAAKVAFLVEGVRCVRTAERASMAFQDEPGVVRFTAFAARNTIEIL